MMEYSCRKVQNYTFCQDLNLKDTKKPNQQDQNQNFEKFENFENFENSSIFAETDFQL